MYRNFEEKSIYETLSMQAALRLYLPHTDSSCSLPAVEFSEKSVPLEHLIAPGKLGEIIHHIFKGNKK